MDDDKCPICKGPLGPKAARSVTGALICESCAERGGGRPFRETTAISDRPVNATPVKERERELQE